MKRFIFFAPNATVFFASAAIMVVELVAGRLVARHLGMSLYTWTAIIAVMMGGMASGNYLGGRWADRYRAAPALTLLLVVAAVACVALLPLNALLGNLSVLIALPWVPRILLHTLLLFFLPALALGAIAPVGARLAIALAHKEGRAVGAVFASGVAGSILGTFLTGYYLLYLLRVTTILLSASGVLALLGMLWAIAWSRHAKSPEDAPGPLMAGADRGAILVRARFGPALTVIVSNAAFMALELAASRMLSREFGASLYTWTSIIGVVLAGIAFGNYGGGRLADKRATSRTLARLFVLASAAVALSPLAAEFLRRLYLGSATFGMLSWPARILLYAAGAFFLPSFAIGFISPVVVKRALDNGWATGDAVGRIYAWGAAGGIAATLLTGYVLIDAWGAVTVVYAVALLLALAALALSERRVPAALWAMYCVALILLAGVDLPFFEKAGSELGVRRARPPRIVHEDETRYSYLAVVAEPETPRIRSLAMDMLLHSELDLDDPESLRYEYEWVYDGVLRALHPAPAPVTALIVGGGGFTYPNYLALTRPGSYIETVEIDPAVTQAAFDWFGLPRDTPIHIQNMDGRNRVADLVRAKAAGETVPEFDCIFMDSVNDFAVPPHLVTLEFVRQLDALLKDGGVYMLNLIDLLDSGGFTASIVRTCREVFPFVTAFNTSRMTSVRDTIVVVCAKHALALDDVSLRLRGVHNFDGGRLPESYLDSLVSRKGLLLTDDYAPVENLLEPVIQTRAPDPAAYAYDRAKQALAEGRLEDALAECRQAVLAHPDWPEALATLEEIRGAESSKLKN